MHFNGNHFLDAYQMQSYLHQFFQTTVRCKAQSTCSAGSLVHGILAAKQPLKSPATMHKQIDCRISIIYCI